MNKPIITLIIILVTIPSLMHSAEKVGIDGDTLTIGSGNMVTVSRGGTVTVSRGDLVTINGRVMLTTPSDQLIFGEGGSSTTINIPHLPQRKGHNGSGRTITFPGGDSDALVVLTTGPYVIKGNWAFHGNLDISGESDFKGTASGRNCVIQDKGYYVENVIKTPIPAAKSGEFGDLAVLPLPAGEWDIFGIGGVSVGSSVCSDVRVVISAHSGNNQTDHTQGDNMFTIASPVQSVSDSSGMTYWRRATTTPMSFYLKMKMDYTGKPRIYGKMWARRVR
ncbi:MAG: hypothetical protein LHV69_00785 [Elusimicrobia bacterium]|nr:hypothetical protein [Candidatus Obscuribacterium magneticum]